MKNYVQLVWRSIPGFDRYEINSEGQIRRKKDQIAVSTQQSHIEVVQLFIGSKRYLRSVRKLIRLAFPDLEE